MAVWTISAHEGTDGDRIAAEPAAAAGLPLLDPNALASLAHDIDLDALEIADFDEIESRFGGRLNALASSMAMTTAGSAEAYLREFRVRQKLPELGRAAVAKAARRPCVILAHAAFAALGEHPAAVHVRLRAPLPCRIVAYQRDHLVDRHKAEKALKHDDHRKRAWVRSLYGVDLEDARLFCLVLDTSRFSPERLVEIMLAAGGARAPFSRPRASG